MLSDQTRIRKRARRFCSEARGNTDGEGVYRVFVRSTGGCMLVVDPGGKGAKASVYSYDRPTAYDFDMVFRDGRWQLFLRK
jgi:hypothetical protein